MNTGTIAHAQTSTLASLPPSHHVPRQMPASQGSCQRRNHLIAARQPQGVQRSQIEKQIVRINSRLARGVRPRVQHQQTSLPSSSFSSLGLLGGGREGRKEGEGEGFVQDFGEEGDTEATDVQVGQEGKVGEGRNEGVEEGDMLA